MNDIELALHPPRLKKSRRSAFRLDHSTARVWPLASINGRAPVVLKDHAVPDDPFSLELAYPRFSPTDAIENCPIDTQNGTATHIMPAMTAVLAVADGTIVEACQRGRALAILLMHGNDLVSNYMNLQAVVAIRTDLYRPRTQYVRAGDVIGYVGAPAPGEFKRLRFELWERDRLRGFCSADPRPHLASWEVREHTDHFTPAPPVKEAA